MSASGFLEQKIPEYIIGAFSLMVALSWNDFIKNIFKKLGSENQNLWFEFIYVMFLLVFLAFVVYSVYRARILYEEAKKQLVGIKKIQAISIIDNHAKGVVSIEEPKSHELIFRFNITKAYPQNIYRVYLSKTGLKNKCIVNNLVPIGSVSSNKDGIIIGKITHKNKFSINSVGDGILGMGLIMVATQNNIKHKICGNIIIDKVTDLSTTEHMIPICTIYTQ